MQSLCNKNSTQFWNTWNSKVCNKEKSLPRIEGASCEASAAGIFKNYFETVSNSVDQNFELNMSRKINNLLRSRNSKIDEMHTMHIVSNSFNIMLIDMAVSKLHNGKAAGLDNLQLLHIIKAHPILYDVLAKLFRLIMVKGYCPSDFARGVIIPIQKDPSIKGVQKTENLGA